MANTLPLSRWQVEQLNTFYDFDDKVTAPLHGFNGVDDYYIRASGLPFVNRITKPTLIIHAKDDPFMTDDVIPHPSQISEHVEYELHSYGGHVGFIEGGTPWKPRFYLERRILAFLRGNTLFDKRLSDNIEQGKTMLIPYDVLLQLPKETLANLVREYLFGQVEDGSFASLDEQEMSLAIAQCQQALKQGKLLLEYSEDDESFAIRPADQIAKRQD